MRSKRRKEEKEEKRMSLRPAGFGTSPFSLSDPKKVQLKVKKKFDICDKTVILLTAIGAIALHNSKKERKK